MAAKQSEKHEFALYLATLSKKLQVSSGTILLLDDSVLINRISAILRLESGEQFVLFDQAIHCTCKITQITKKVIECQIIQKNANMVLKPSITFLLPLLKKDDFEAALYSLVELGANKIQLITTQKGQRSWQGQKELERCERIMIAAAEQSKNFAFPELLAPIALPDYLAKISSNKIDKIYFDPEGNAAFSVLSSLKTEQPQEIIVMVGPEGDLTTQEKQLLKAQHFTFCALTPTVLRSANAVVVGLGLIRSILK